MRNLDDGLLLRQATISDTDKLAAFNASIHGYSDEYGVKIAHWTKELLSGNHPTTKASNFLLVEDSKTGEIVSSINIIPQTFRYAEYEFQGSRIELVGTHPQYRRRGLIRAQFETIHQLSERYGHQLQIIEGIPWFYRQFGYEPALESGVGRLGYISNMKEQIKKYPYNIRAANETDIPLISEIYKTSSERYLITGQRDSNQWNYELHGRTSQSLMCREIYVIESIEKELAGFFIQPNRLWGSISPIIVFEVQEGKNWSEITATVIQYLIEKNQESAYEQQGGCDSIGFVLGSNHPVYDLLSNQLTQTMPFSNWYVRVASLSEFLKGITSILERRLAKSVLAGYTGELKISFYRRGVKLLFENGTLGKIVEWQPESVLDGNARFPELTFMQLLFGNRALSELQYAYADCTANDTTSLLLNILFPKSTSFIWSLV